AEGLDQVLDVYHRLLSEGGEHFRPVSRAREAAFPGAVLPKRLPHVSANAGFWRVESVQSGGRSIRAQDGIPISCVRSPLPERFATAWSDSVGRPFRALTVTTLRCVGLLDRGVIDDSSTGQRKRRNAGV